MTVDEVRALTSAMAEHVRAAVVVAAGTGLRQGELFGLTVDRIDFLRRELRVDRQLWSPRTGKPVFAAPKSKASRRTVALSQVVVDALAAHLAAFGAGDHEVVSHTMRGTPVSRVLGGDYIRAAARGRRTLRHHLAQPAPLSRLDAVVGWRKPRARSGAARARHPDVDAHLCARDPLRR